MIYYKRNFVCIVLGFLFLACSKDDGPKIEESLLTEKDIDIERIETTFAMWDIDFLDNTTGFVVNLQGQILKTLDSGASWTELYKSDLELLDVQFIDLNTGFVLGVNKTGDYYLLRTSDSGITFDEVPVHNGSSLSKIYFANFTVGFALGNFMLRSEDHGLTWTEADLPFGPFQDIAASSNGTLYTSGKEIFKSNNLGENWEIHDLGTESALYAALYPFQNIFYFLGQSSLKTDFQITEEFNNHPPSPRTTHVYKENVLVGFGEYYENQGFFPTGAMYISNNSGKSWETILLRDYNRISKIDFIDQKNGFAIAENLAGGISYLLKIGIEEN